MRHAHPIADVLSAIGFPMAHRCRCNAPVPRPGLCRSCTEDEAYKERAARREERIMARIPAAYQWARLDAGGALERKLASQGPTRAARVWLSDPNAPPFMLIRGVTHSYKSTLAAAVARAHLESGRDAFYVFAADIAPPPKDADREQTARHYSALGALANRRALVVINDIAKVLGGAAGDSGMAAWRRGELCSELHRRCEARSRTVITTTLENRSGSCEACSGKGASCAVCGGTGRNAAPGLVECFGEDIMARLTDPLEALMIRLERKRQP